jgi:hypothetical protein
MRYNPTASEYTFFSAAHGTVSKIGGNIRHKGSQQMQEK